MNGPHQEKTSRPLEEPVEHAVPHLSWLRHPLAWRRTRQLRRILQANNQRLAWHVQDILIGCNLSQADYSIGGGRVIHVPEVVSVVAGPPMGLDIRTLPGQMPEDFAAHSPAIAWSLGVAEVRVVALGPSLIRLELLRGPGHEATVE